MGESKAGIQVRFAVADDAASIASVIYESFVEYEALYTREGFAATTPTSEQIQTRLSEGAMWVAIQHDTIVGTIAVVPKGESLYVRSTAILPGARGAGIGRLLLEHVEDFACKQGYQRLFLSSTPFLTRAIRLYEHFGFRRNGEEPRDLFGAPLFTMEKNLTA